MLSRLRKDRTFTDDLGKLLGRIETPLPFLHYHLSRDVEIVSRLHKRYEGRLPCFFWRSVSHPLPRPHPLGMN